MKTIITLASLLATASLASASTINVAFHNGGVTTGQMTSSAAGTVVDTSSDTWNNIQNNSGIGLNFTNEALVLADNSATTSTISSNAGTSYFNTHSGQSQDYAMMDGWYGLRNTESITFNLSNEFTSSGYIVTIYGDSDSASRVMNYTIAGSAEGTQTITDSGKFAGSFSEGDNFVTFTGLNSSSFTITGNSGASDPRSAITGVTITAVPEPSATALLGLGGIGLILRRRK